MTNWAILALVFPVSCSLTWLVLRLARRKSILDIPVSRSAHRVPTPTGGGLAFITCFYFLASLGFAQSRLQFELYMACLGGLLVAGLGLADDLHRLSIRTRLFLQFVASFWTLLWLGETPVLQFGSLIFDLPWLVFLLSVVAMVWLINLYNFMDGIDGLAAAEACSVTAMSFLMAINMGDSITADLSIMTGLAVAGFLVFNWPPARIFMGDAGSGFLGYLFGLLAFYSMISSSISLWSWLILLGVFVVDASFTLFRRVLSGQSWSEGHSGHGYQIAARRFGEHRQVTLTVMLINLFWLAPLAIYANAFPGLGVYLALVAMVPLAMLACRLSNGAKD